MSSSCSIYEGTFHIHTDTLPLKAVSSMWIVPLRAMRYCGLLGYIVANRHSVGYLFHIVTLLFQGLNQMSWWNCASFIDAIIWWFCLHLVNSSFPFWKTAVNSIPYNGSKICNVCKLRLPVRHCSSSAPPSVFQAWLQYANKAMLFSAFVFYYFNSTWLPRLILSWTTLSSVGTMYIHANSVCIKQKRAPGLMAQQSLPICLRIDFNISTSFL